MTRHWITTLLFCSITSAFAASSALAVGDREWRVYSQEANSDVYLYDASRVKRASEVQTVWQRIRYRRSVMGASSYESLLEVDCSGRTERILQRTFFSDKDWENRAMNTDMKEKPKRTIAKGSAAERLFAILCDP